MSRRKSARHADSLQAMRRDGQRAKTATAAFKHKFNRLFRWNLKSR